VKIFRWKHHEAGLLSRELKLPLPFSKIVNMKGQIRFLRKRITHVEETSDFWRSAYLMFLGAVAMMGVAFLAKIISKALHLSC
jgi:hypothetical protein